MSGEERLEMERARERAIELPPEAWPVRAVDKPSCCEDCDPAYARAVQS